MSHPLPRITTFLHEIGLQVRPGDVPTDSFLPGIRINRGTLVFDALQLKWPGDLLHEAGHLAVTPTSRRAALDGALGDDDPAKEITEVEAIAWSWAALVHLDLPADLLFHPGGYRGSAASLRLSFELGVFPGACRLAQWGMTSVGASALAEGVATYPRMQCWLRPG